MVELTVAKEWIERARVLLRSSKLSGKDHEVESLREGLQAFSQDPATQKALPRELTVALGELAQALSGDLDLDLGGELSPEDEDTRKFYEDFRSDFVLLRKALDPVLNPAEAANLDLALELADGHGRLRGFEAALTLLQQASHRAREIQRENRAGALDEGELKEQDRAEQTLLREKALAAIQKASDELAHKLRALDPMSPKERAGSQGYAVAVQKLMLEDRLDLVLPALGAWSEWVDEVQSQEAEGSPRRTQQRQAALEQIPKDKAKYQAELVAIARLLSQYKGAPQTDLESAIGPLVFEVERLLQSLGDREPSSEREVQAAARTLVEARTALLALKTKLDEAKQLLASAKEQFDSNLREKNAAVDTKQLALTAAEKQRDEYGTQLGLKREKGANGRVVMQPLTEKDADYYRSEVKRIDELKTKLSRGKSLSENEVAQLKFANLLLVGYDELAKRRQAVDTATSDLTLKTKDLESAKLPQEIWWATPPDATYGIPLDGTQLDASLSAGSGRIAYKFKGQAIEPGKAVLAAGDGQLLVAAVLDSDTAIYRATPEKTVTINVRKAKVTLHATTSLAFTYGTPFSLALLAADVVTEPALPDERKTVLSTLACKADGQPVAANQVLNAKGWTLTVQCAASANFDASNEVTVALTVQPAAQAITWDGAVPSAITFGAALVKGQLNATVSVTTDPPLNDRWASLTAALEYVDEQDRPVKVGTVLDVGDARRITARTPARPNFLDAPLKSVVFQVARAVRTLATGTPPAIGAVVQSNDLKRLHKVFKFTAGKGTVEFFVDKVQLAVGSKLKSGKKEKMRVAAKADDNYLPTAEQDLEIEVQGFTDKFTGAKNGHAQLLLKKVHSLQKAAVDLLKQEVEGLALLTGASDEDKFTKIDALLEEIDEIEANLLTWQGDVPSPSPKGDEKLLTVEIDVEEGDTGPQKQRKKIDKTVEAVVKLIKHGGIKLADIEKLVPSGSSSTYKPSTTYPVGFKYIWTTPSGVEVEIYGHRATVATNVPAGSDSKKGNLVRVKIDEQYLRPDGTRTAVSTDASSHMPLY